MSHYLAFQCSSPPTIVHIDTRTRPTEDEVFPRFYLVPDTLQYFSTTQKVGGTEMYDKEPVLISSQKPLKITFWTWPRAKASRCTPKTIRLDQSTSWCLPQIRKRTQSMLPERTGRKRTTLFSSEPDWISFDRLLTVAYNRVDDMLAILFPHMSRVIMRMWTFPTIMIYSRPLPGDPLFIAHARNSSHPIYHTAHVHTHKVSIYTTHIYSFLISSLLSLFYPKLLLLRHTASMCVFFWYTCVLSADYAPGSVSFHVSVSSGTFWFSRVCTHARSPPFRSITASFLFSIRPYFFFWLTTRWSSIFFAAVHIICINYPCITPRFPLNTKLCIIIKHTKIYVVYFDSQHANGSLDGPASAFICTTRLMDTLELLDGPGFSHSSSGGMRYSSSSCSDINGWWRVSSDDMRRSGKNCPDTLTIFNIEPALPSTKFSNLQAILRWNKPSTFLV